MILCSRTTQSVLAVAAMLLCAQTTLRAQGTTPPPDTSKGTFGLVLDGAWNLHQANFQNLPDVPNCCPQFQSGSGLGGEFGLFYDYDAFGSGHLGVRAGMSFLSGTLKADEPMTIAINGSAVQGTIEHSIGAHLT